MTAQNKQGFTPGPWKYDFGILVDLIIVRAGRKLICSLMPDQEGDAKLIESSPDLLYLLKETIQYLDSGDYPENQAQYKLYKKCEKIILKLNGKSK